MNKQKLIVIKDPPKMWSPGDPRVEKFMSPVTRAIKRHIKWPSDEFSDIYNRAYEAVWNAIREYAGEEDAKEKVAVAPVDDTIEACLPERHQYYILFLSYKFCPYCGKRLTQL